MKRPRKLHRSAMLSVRKAVLLIVGLAMIITAAFLLHIVAGFAVAGLALFYLEDRLAKE